jgi:type IV pilus assembly protein PilY1
LSTPIVIDTDGDKVADAVYAGDLKGNMWAFDISASNTNSWGFKYSQGNTPKPLFTACADDPCTDPQPITSKPQASKTDSGSIMVLFGTGKYFETGDNTDISQVQSYYGVQDDSAVVAGRDELVAQTILVEFTAAQTGLSYNTRVTSNYNVDLSAKDGWYIDFDSSNYPGERIVSNSLVRNGRVIFPTLVSETDPCSSGGTSWLMELDADTGARLTISPFDLNGDGVIDNNDLVGIDTDGDGQVDTNVAVSGKESTVGIIKTPGVISTGKDEKKYTSGSSGQIEVTTESAGDTLGRQSWKQLK